MREGKLYNRERRRLLTLLLQIFIVSFTIHKRLSALFHNVRKSRQKLIMFLNFSGVFFGLSVEVEISLCLPRSHTGILPSAHQHWVLAHRHHQWRLKGWRRPTEGPQQWREGQQCRQSAVSLRVVTTDARSLLTLSLSLNLRILFLRVAPRCFTRTCLSRWWKRTLIWIYLLKHTENNAFLENFKFWKIIDVK